MGMAASQARLLTITARIHDVEYQAQSIQNAKIQLSTQSDQVYQDYLEALDATTLTIQDTNGNTITANFNNLCGKNAVDSANKYALRTSNGALIVTDEVYKAYQEFKDQDANVFAMAMIDGCGGATLGENDLNNLENNIESEVYENIKNDSTDKSNAKTTMENLKSTMSNILSDYNNDYQTLVGAAETDPKAEEDLDKYDNAREQFRYLLYKNYGDDIYAKAYEKEDKTITAEDFDQDSFNYYRSVFQQIKAAGGCVPISDYNGLEGMNGDAATDSDWLQNMIQCGKISIEIVKTDDSNGKTTFSTTSPSSDSYVGYTPTTTIDKTALAKAEAEYEHETKVIDQKDKKYDMDLSKLESERTALTTEYDSVKKVIEDNIDRTFGIFS